MKYSVLAVFLIVLAAACGSKQESPNLREGYDVGTEVGFEGSVDLSFQETYLFHNISLGVPQSSKCAAHANDYMSKANVAFVPGSLKLSFGPNPDQQCTSRNIFKQCETYQYVYTFHCRYQIQK